MSFYADPVLLFLDGEGLCAAAGVGSGQRAAKWSEERRGRVFSPPVTGSSGPGWTKRMWKPFGAKSGTSSCFRLARLARERHRRTPRTDAVAAVVFAAYPLAWWLGWDHGRGAGRTRWLPAARDRLIAELREHALVIGEVTLTSGARPST